MRDGWRRNPAGRPVADLSSPAQPSPDRQPRLQTLLPDACRCPCRCGGLNLWLPDGLAIELLDHGDRDWGVCVVFAVVYRGMLLGGLPRLKLDRSGVALLGAIAVISVPGQLLHRGDAARSGDAAVAQRAAGDAIAVAGVLPALVWAWLH
jgi:hypothetical protein